MWEAGYQRYGNEVLYNGFTGRKMQAQVFFGPTYYQRLKHMVDDKIHARARGPLANLTRQPVEVSSATKRWKLWGSVALVAAAVPLAHAASAHVSSLRHVFRTRAGRATAASVLEKWSATA